VYRTYFGQLSRYYRLPPGKEAWCVYFCYRKVSTDVITQLNKLTTIDLPMFFSVLEDLDDWTHLLVPSGNSPSTSTAGVSQKPAEVKMLSESYHAYRFSLHVQESVALSMKKQ
jgi:hypothetical protein